MRALTARLRDDLDLRFERIAFFQSKIGFVSFEEQRCEDVGEVLADQLERLSEFRLRSLVDLDDGIEQRLLCVVKIAELLLQEFIALVLLRVLFERKQVDRSKRTDAI